MNDFILRRGTTAGMRKAVSRNSRLWPVRTQSIPPIVSPTHFYLSMRRLLFSSIIIVWPLLAMGQAPKQRPVTGPTGTATPAIPADKTAAHATWSFLPLGATHADVFQQDHPTYDGRGVIVYIFDTGV